MAAQHFLTIQNVFRPTKNEIFFKKFCLFTTNKYSFPKQ